MAEAFLRFVESKRIRRTGAVYKEDLKGEIAEGNLALLHYEKGKLISQGLVGSDLPKALKEIGENFNEMALFTLFGLEDTTGADYKQPDKGKALLTIGEGQTKTKTIQAAMRMRRLLLGSNGQTISWVITKELAAQIPHDRLNAMTVQDLFAWMIDNEAHLMERALVMRGYQGIQHLVQKVAWSEILSSEEPMATYRRYSEGLVDHVESDPYLTYGEVAAAPAEQVLRNFALRCYRSLGFADDQLLRLTKEDRAYVELIIDQTKRLVESISTGVADLSGEMFQHQEVRQEQSQEQRQNVEQLASFSTEKMRGKNESACNQDNLWEPHFLTAEHIQSPNNPYHRLNERLGMEFIPEDLYVSENYFEVMEPRSSFTYSSITEETSPPVPFLLRPFKYLVVIRETGPDHEVNFKYLPCSMKGANHFIDNLDGKDWGNNFSRVPMKQLPSNKQAVLIDLKGRVIKNGKGALGFDDAGLQRLKDSADFKKRATLLAFLNGRIQNLTILNQITAVWSDELLEETWKRILAIKIGERPPDFSLMDELRRMRRWNGAPFHQLIAPVRAEGVAIKRYAFSAHQVSSAQPIRPALGLISRVWNFIMQRE